MTAIDLLSEVIAQRTKISAAAVRKHPDYHCLIDNGFLCETGVLSSVACNECDMPHSTELIFQDGEYGFHCHDLGWMSVSRHYIVGVLPDIPVLIDRLANTFDCRQRKNSAINGQTWRIGLVETTTEPVALYFHPTLRTEDDLNDLRSALAQETRSLWRLIVAAHGTLTLPKTPVVQLGDLVEIESGELSEISDPGILAGVPQVKKGGRPSAQGDLLKPLIEGRIRSGNALKGINAEAREIRALFLTSHPDKAVPSDSTIKRSIREARGGS